MWFIEQSSLNDNMLMNRTFFLIGITPSMAVMPLKHKGLRGIEEFGTETLMMSGKRIIRWTADS